MAIPVSAAEGYRLWADSWDETPSPIVALESRMLQPWLAEIDARPIIDVGCGTGRLTAPLSAIGLDGSFAMLAVAARKPGLSGKLAVATATSLPVATAAAGQVLCTLTFGHIRDQAAALYEFARILRPGGSLILTDFHPVAAAHGWRRTFSHNGQAYELENHSYSIDWLRDQGAAVGLQPRDWIEASIAEPERELFHRAGRPDLFAAACRTPAVLLSRWTRL